MGEERTTPVERPWNLTLEQRLQLLEDRLARSEMRIRGRENPELIFPGEAFDFLLIHISGLGARLRPLQDKWDPVREAVGLPDSFYEELTEISSAHLMLMLEQRFPMEEIGTREKYRRHFRLCESRLQTLDAARDRFGAEAFDRFLYETIVPGIGVSYTSRSSIDEIEFRETGCPVGFTLGGLIRFFAGD